MRRLGSIERRKLAQFTVELLEARIAAIVPQARVHYQGATRGNGSAAQFVDWCISNTGPFRLIVHRGTGVADVSCTCELFGFAEASTFRSSRAHAAEAFREIANEKQPPPRTIAVEGGDVRLSVEEFVEWLLTFDLGDLGVVTGNWVCERTGAQFRIVSNAVRHDRDFGPHRLSWIQRIFLRLLKILGRRQSSRR